MKQHHTHTNTPTLIGLIWFVSIALLLTTGCQSFRRDLKPKESQVSHQTNQKSNQPPLRIDDTTIDFGQQPAGIIFLLAVVVVVVIVIGVIKQGQGVDSQKRIPPSQLDSSLVRPSGNLDLKPKKEKVTSRTVELPVQ